ncbi:hypothetical protein AJ87_14830 [Rhizobium yanglingense]|nr:hypothetical protein AJ87_14830 [Rhizobium yanglingense]
MRKTAPREQVNREFYRLFRNTDLNHLRRLARDWFTDEMASNADLFIPETCRLLEQYRRQGAIIVFLSGSADFIIEPIARHLGGATVLAIHLADENGIATGELAGIQTIGAGKREALEAFVRENALSLAGSVAFGDHISDLPFLEIVDHPVAVGGDQELERVAHQNGWPILEVAHLSPTA